jgi:hypothetical protein
VSYLDQPYWKLDDETAELVDDIFVELREGYRRNTIIAVLEAAAKVEERRAQERSAGAG